MQEKICMCSVLTNGVTIIYIINDDESWIEPCIIRVHGKPDPTRISFQPLQIFSITSVMPAINQMHILTSYSPEPEIESSYRSFLCNYLKDVEMPVN